MSAAVLLVSGCSLSFLKHNDENEVFILVDDSYSTKEKDNTKNTLVREMLDNTPKNVKTGIIRFGYDYVLAKPLGFVDSSTYDAYLNSARPDDKASNIALAINKAKDDFSNPKSAKIVVFSDMVETDGNAKKLISSVALEGVKVDVLQISSNQAKKEVMPVRVSFPKVTIIKDKPINLELEILSNVRTDANIRVYDNGVEASNLNVILKNGSNKLSVSHTFKALGLHELTFTVEASSDELKLNNKLYSYAYLETVNKILILERTDEGSSLYNLFKDDYKIQVKNIKDAPLEVDELREYDEVILANISNKDMPLGFIDVLEEYVKVYGGSMLTIGGKKADGTPNVYNREDMKDTKYQDMLPVLAENYTPPVGVMLVIDNSGSMNGIVTGTDKTRMEVAKEAAIKALDALDTRDYLGVVTFGSFSKLELSPTPVADRLSIESAIKRLNWQNSGTLFSRGLQEAGLALQALQGVNKKHLILLTDGEPADHEYLDITAANYAAGITTSTISFLEHSSTLEQISRAGHGKSYTSNNLAELERALKTDLASPEIREFEVKDFKPKPLNDSSLFNGVNLEDTPILSGFYGTKLKKGANALMVGDYNQPIYAIWDYGKGKASSFMADLNGDFSQAFLSNPNGKKILANMLDSLFPVSHVSKKKIEVTLARNNILTEANIYSEPILENEKLQVTINKLVDKDNFINVDTIALNSFNGNTNVSFALEEPGIYEVLVEKLNSVGEVYASERIYEAVSYSKEYNSFIAKNPKEIEELVKLGNGNIISKGEDSYKDLVLFFNVDFDMRYVLAGIILVFALADIAVRKFKFRWLHEIIRNRKGGRK